MGKCETSSTSIGIKILLSDLIFQINEKNFDLIKQILNDGFISDSNDYYNGAYTEIILCNDLPKNYLEFKDFLEQEFKNKGSYLHRKSSNKIETDVCWRKNRDRPIDFDLSVDLEKYKEIEKYTIIFILEQNSG